MHPAIVVGDHIVQWNKIPIFAKRENRIRLRLHLHRERHQIKIKRIFSLGVPHCCRRGVHRHRQLGKNSGTHKIFKNQKSSSIRYQIATQNVSNNNNSNNNNNNDNNKNENNFNANADENDNVNMNTVGGRNMRHRAGWREDLLETVLGAALNVAAR